MEKALDLHHSKLMNRVINVELTAGGGGHKSEKRKERIKTKNEKLNEERVRIANILTASSSNSKHSLYCLLQLETNRAMMLTGPNSIAV